MTIRLLQLDLKRLRRSVVEMPPVVWPVLLALAAGGGWILHGQFSKSPNTYVIWAVATSVLLSAHGARRDFDFCRLVLKNPRSLFVVEYLLCFAPFIILSLVTRTYHNTCLYLLSPVAIALSPRRKASSPIKRIPAFLHIHSLELVSFARRYFIAIIPTLAAATIFSFTPGVSIAALVLFVLSMNYAYAESEPLDMVLLPELGPVKFLLRKIAAGFAMFIGLSAPALLLYVVFNPGTFWLAIIPVLFALVAIPLYVFVKYALWDSGGGRITFPMMVSLGITGLIVPLFLPLTLLVMWRYGLRAKENLNRYLHVYDN
jgi:hypothetical protein